MDQSGLPIHALQEQRTEVAGNRTALEVGTDREAGHDGKTQLGRGRIRHGRSRLASSEALLE
jgi:hypothetical protein